MPDQGDATIQPRKLARFGWKKDHPDYRDRKLAIAAPVPTPPVVDLRFGLSCYDQLTTSSCVGNAVAGALQYEQHKRGEPLVIPSRLFLYYNARRYERSTMQDNGSQIRDAIKGLAKIGVCAETMWPFDEESVTHQPGRECYDAAKLEKAIDYAKVPQLLPTIKQTLVAGVPIIFGFTVYSGFESPEVAKTGIVGMPQAGEDPIGGHAVLCVGYSEPAQMFLVRNSWSDEWGGPMVGHFQLPYDYLLNPDLSSDLWCVRRTS